MTTSTIPNLSPAGSPRPWILPRPAWQTRLLTAARFVVATASVLAHTTPITLGLALGWLIANLLGGTR